VQIRDRSETGIVNRRAVARIFPLANGGFRFQLDVLHDDEFRWDEFDRELTKLFLLSQSFAGKPAQSVQDRLAPWIWTGIHELVRYRRSGRPADVFDALLDSRQMLTLEELLEASPGQFRDSVSRQIYAACSAALVQALLDQPSGRRRLQVFLSDLAGTDQKVNELLREHFSNLRQDPENLEKWWALQMATMSQRKTFRFYSVEETETRLAELLIVAAPAPETPPPGSTAALDPDDRKPEAESDPEPEKGWWSFLRRRLPNRSSEPLPDENEEDGEFEPVPLREIDTYLDRPWSGRVLEAKQVQLAKLRSRAFPLYQPVLPAYDRILSDLRNGITQGVPDRLDELERRRRALREQARGIKDHMNWFATTQIDELSDEFEGYGQALRLLENLENRRRTDPISRYLDAVEREVTR